MNKKQTNKKQANYTKYYKSSGQMNFFHGSMTRASLTVSKYAHCCIILSLHLSFNFISWLTLAHIFHTVSFTSLNIHVYGLWILLFETNFFHSAQANVNP